MSTSKCTVRYVATQLGLTQSKAEQLLDFTSHSLLCLLKKEPHEIEIGELGRIKLVNDELKFIPSDKTKKFINLKEDTSNVF